MTQNDLPVVYLGGIEMRGDVYMWAVAEDGTLLGSHMCSSRAYGRHDLHDRSGRHQVYIDKFGGFGDGVHYRLVEVDTWADVPQQVRDLNKQKACTYGYPPEDGPEPTTDAPAGADRDL